MNSLKIFDYNGTKITFENDGKVMINVTEFAKAFPEKNLTQIVQSNEIQEYIETLAKLQNYSSADLLIVRRGGNDLSKQGTWANSKVALRIAQKLSSEFAVWVDMRIEELLTTGQTALSNLTHPSRKQLAQWVIELEDQKEKLAKENAEQERKLQEVAPKAEYCDKVLQSNTLITTTVIAKDLGMSAEALNDKLHKLGVIYKSGKTWVLYREFQDKGYTATKTHVHKDREGNDQTSIHTYWTEAGRLFIHKKLHFSSQQILQLK